MDKIQSMQVFVRVAELNNFTRAAESLGLPKGSVSRLVQQLEARMSARLLHRSTRRVQLTQDGQVFYERCKELLANMDELESMFQTNPTTVSGKIRVDMPLTMATNLVLPRLSEFLNRYPALEIELSSSDHRVDVVREGFDCVVSVGHLKDSGLIARTLGELSVVNCASPDYIKRYGQPEHPDHLANHAMVNYDHALRSRGNEFEYLEGKELKRVKSGGAITVNSTVTYTAACLSGLGIIQVPRIGVQGYLEQGRLVLILPRFLPPPMPVTLVYPHRRHLSRRVKIFMDWLREIMQTYIG
ncbi:LysR family transcriptional regulator [Rouxiella sp. T17]|uniref:LysR family transcriptional regulator n=1 Tax=Rouxiella sp. T17 TaxID=3085684 RepID=UPI002FCA4EDA